MRPKYKATDFNMSFKKMLDRIDTDMVFSDINKANKKDEQDLKRMGQSNLLHTVDKYSKKSPRHVEHLQNQYGFSGLGKRDDGYSDDIYLNDLSRITNQNVKGLTTSQHRSGNAKNRIIMETQPNPLSKNYKKEKHDWDMIYSHEKSHQGRPKDAIVREGHLPSHERHEEKLADYGSLDVLQQNLKRAGMDYTPQTGRDYIDLDTKSENIIENPSKVPYKNRLEFLPVAQPDREYTMLNTDWRDASKINASTTKDWVKSLRNDEKVYNKSIGMGLYNKDTKSKGSNDTIFPFGTKKKHLLWNKDYVNARSARDKISKTPYAEFGLKHTEPMFLDSYKK